VERIQEGKMALPSAFWLPVAGLLIVAPLPASAASFWTYAGGYALTSSDHCAPKGTATSATCDATNTSTDPVSGETKSGRIHVGADLASGDLFVHAESEGSIPTAEAGGEAQIGDTLTFGGAISSTSATTLTMSGTMSNSNGFTAGSLEIFDDNGLLTAGGACSEPNSYFICDATNSQTKVSVVGNSFFVSSTVNNLSLHKEVLVEFIVYASSFLTSSADISDPITIDVSPGVTFTSASGEFLTGANSVPETSTWVMMLLGFAGLGFAGYRGGRLDPDRTLAALRRRSFESEASERQRRGVRSLSARHDSISQRWISSGVVRITGMAFVLRCGITITVMGLPTVYQAGF
jgi:hypothetical protein